MVSGIRITNFAITIMDFLGQKVDLSKKFKLALSWTPEVPQVDFCKTYLPLPNSILNYSDN